MTAVVSPQTSSSMDSTPQEVAPQSLPPSSQSAAALPPLVSAPPPSQVPGTRSSRPVPHMKSRLSAMSQASGCFGSRPQSTAYPVFHSSLSYTLVRDFAYPSETPLFYGPLPERPSEASTPASEVQNRRVSDSSLTWDGSRGRSAMPRGEQLPSTSFGDGPPWSEDDDLHSPVVTSARHRKHKSNVVGFDGARSRGVEQGARRGSYQPTNGSGNHAYYVSNLDETANGPGGADIIHPARDHEAPVGRLAVSSSVQGSSQQQPGLMDVDEVEYASDNDDGDDVSETSSEGGFADESRYSRDYQFTIASPDEEMHGKAVALFDFERENDNELPLTEGQIILVSYRHGQGWLVAQDPRSGESGLVPEEYVRLLRDIEGGLNGLMNGAAPLPPFGIDYTGGTTGSNNTNDDDDYDDDDNDDEDFGANSQTPVACSHAETLTPTAQTPHHQHHHRRDVSGQSTASSEYYMPVVSTFSTSSKDLQKYPQRLLGSQTTTPTGDGPIPRRASKVSSGQASGSKRDSVEAKAGDENEARARQQSV